MTSTPLAVLEFSGGTFILEMYPEDGEPTPQVINRINNNVRYLQKFRGMLGNGLTYIDGNAWYVIDMPGGSVSSGSSGAPLRVPNDNPNENTVLHHKDGLTSWVPEPVFHPSDNSIAIAVGG